MPDSPDTSSLSSVRLASFSVPIARDPEFHISFLSNYLRKLWMKHHYTATAPFPCICSESPCSIQELLRALGISSKEDIRLFSQRMESCLEDISENSGRLIKSSGRTKKTSKSRKNLKTGKTSRSGSSKKERMSHGQDGK